MTIYSGCRGWRSRAGIRTTGITGIVDLGMKGERGCVFVRENNSLRCMICHGIYQSSSMPGKSITSSDVDHPLDKYPQAR